MNKTNERTEQQKMQLNQTKAKTMILNYTEKFQFYIKVIKKMSRTECNSWEQFGDDLKRNQKTFVKLVLREKYLNYESALAGLN